MHIRRLELSISLFALVVGATIPVGVLTGPSGTLLVTFLGLVAASILPTITLMLSSMSAGGRSVMKLGELHLELRAGIKALFNVFAWAAGAVILLVVLAMPMPSVFSSIVPIGEYLTRTMQGAALMLTVLSVLRARAIPEAIHRCLDLMAEIAADTARKRTIENAPKTGEPSSTFATREGFGRTISLEELRSRDPH